MDTYRNNQSGRGTNVPLNTPRRTADAHRAARPESAAAPKTTHRTNFMRYANDNRIVKAIYSFTTGKTKPLFIALVVFAIGIGVYFPVRDYYCAQRSGEVLTRQLELQKAYEKKSQKQVDTLLSKEGIIDTARKKFGMVMEGEKTLEVEGLDSGSSKKSSKKSSTPSTLAELEKAQQEVVDDVPWYVKALDAVFGFNGVEGQEVTSTGK